MPAGVLRRLAQFCESGQHIFWVEDISLRDRRLFKETLPVTHRQITDIYLLGLAKRKQGKLATFDRHIPLGAVVDADRGHLEVIPL
jgi:hypothetical protein